MTGRRALRRLPAWEYARPGFARVTANARLRGVGGVLALVALYRGIAQVGYELQFAGPVAAIVWLPVGVGIAFLYIGGLRYWPGVLIGDLLANDYGALPPGSAMAQTCGNVLEVIGATLLLRRLVPGGQPLDNVRDLARMLAVIAAGTVVSATIGAAALLAGEVISGDELPDVWRTWWLGDVSGALIVLPLALAWWHPLHGWTRRRVAELAAVVAIVALLSELALRGETTPTYVVFLALLWSALRLGRRGATLTVAVAAGFAIWETTRRVGPFAFESITHSIVATQLYIAVSALSALCLAVVVAERKAFERSLAASRSRLVEATACERRRIERNLHDGAQQRLVALRVRLRIAAERGREAPGTAASVLEIAEAELAAALDELRELAHGIHPSIVTDHGLGHALEGLVENSPTPLRLLERPSARVAPTAEVVAYFVVLEAVANARKYAQAESIDIRARTGDGALHVEVADRGVGGADESIGSGLQGLRDRVEAIGGTFEVHSGPGAGTRVVAILPAALNDD
jgi:signal transduction histidine kinase